MFPPMRPTPTNAIFSDMNDMGWDDTNGVIIQDNGVEVAARSLQMAG